MQEKENYFPEEVAEISELTAKCEVEYQERFEDMFKVCMKYVNKVYNKKEFIFGLNAISSGQSKNLKKYQQGVPENVRKNSELEGMIKENLEQIEKFKEKADEIGGKWRGKIQSILKI